MADGVFGQQQAQDGASDFNTLSFVIRTALGRVRTGVPVVVKAVHGGGVGAPPTVDVQPLINAIDGQGNQTAHGTIVNLPVLRLQGGKNAIIIDPQVDDIGWLVIADRDTSALRKNQGKRSNPGSFRRFNLADGAYFGGFLNPADPTQYVQFTTSGIKIADKNGNVIELKSGQIAITGNVVVDGNISATGSITAGQGGADQVGLQTHTHPSNGSPPTPGT